VAVDVMTPARAGTEAQPDVLRALRGLEGRATVGDVVAATGLAHETAQQTLRDLLATYRGSIAVGAAGDLMFSFDPDLIRRDHTTRWTRLKRTLKRFFTAAFKAWIVLMLVVYFVIFVALVVAALVAMMSGDRRGSSRRSRHGGHLPIGWILYPFWVRGWHRRRPYYGHRWEQRQGDGVRVPFYKKVFAYVFGPDERVVSREERDRDVIALIRARRGVLGTAEYIAHSGLTREQANQEMGRLMGAYEGDVRVTQTGDVVYLFPELMLSAHGRVRAAEPPPAWRRLESERSATGNTKGTDALITGLNGFNLVAAVAGPFTFLPQLGLQGPVVMVGLVAVPLMFSALFFAVPTMRRAALRRENAARRRRNVRKVLVGQVFAAALEQRTVTVGRTANALRAALADKTIGDHLVADELGQIVTEYEADVEASAGGEVEFRFPDIRLELEATEDMRTRLALDRRRVGAIVYDTDDTGAQAAARDLAAFDEELRRRLPSADATSFDEPD